MRNDLKKDAVSGCACISERLEVLREGVKELGSPTRRRGKDLGAGSFAASCYGRGQVGGCRCRLSACQGGVFAIQIGRLALSGVYVNTCIHYNLDLQSRDTLPDLGPKQCSVPAAVVSDYLSRLPHVLLMSSSAQDNCWDSCIL